MRGPTDADFTIAAIFGVREPEPVQQGRCAALIVAFVRRMFGRFF